MHGWRDLEEEGGGDGVSDDRGEKGVGLLTIVNEPDLEGGVQTQLLKCLDNKRNKTLFRQDM